MRSTRDLAIVLKAVPYQERHQIVTALTQKSGKISALARNSIQSRRFGGALQPFSASEWGYSQSASSDLHHLQEATIKRAFEGLRGSFEALSLASAFNEMILRVAPQEDPCPELFRLHSNALTSLEELALAGQFDLKATFTILNAYLAKLLQWNGNQPRMETCFGCAQALDSVPEGPLVCWVEDAAWICDTCRKLSTIHVERRGGGRFTLNRMALRDFWVSLGIPIRSIAEKAVASVDEHRELFFFLEALLIYHVPGFDRVPINGLKFLNLR